MIQTFVDFLITQIKTLNVNDYIIEPTKHSIKYMKDKTQFFSKL